MLAIIKACGSNFSSIQFALDRLGRQSVLTNDVAVIKQASHVILPGVGHANRSMMQLRDSGLVDVLRQLEQPVLGICLGMQLLYDSTEEGDILGLGLIPGKIKKIRQQQSERIPHMGWNTVNFVDKSHPLYQNSENELYTYFVHNYVAPINEYTVATTEYAGVFTSIVQCENFMGMQFHPERSGKFGEQLLKNFTDQFYFYESLPNGRPGLLWQKCIFNYKDTFDLRPPFL